MERERYRGCLIGLSIGDGLGTTPDFIDIFTSYRKTGPISRGWKNGDFRTENPRVPSSILGLGTKKI